MQTPENFRSLASLLREERASADIGLDAVADDVIPPYDEVIDEVIDDASDDELALGREVRLFHVRVIEGVEAAVERIVTDIAADVVARELLLEPADIEAIVDRALQRFSREEPLRVRVHREDAPRVSCGFPIVADDALRPGDAIVELRTGSVNASLGVRLSAILAAALT